MGVWGPFEVGWVGSTQGGVEVGVLKVTVNGVKRLGGGVGCRGVLRRGGRGERQVKAL